MATSTLIDMQNRLKPAIDALRDQFTAEEVYSIVEQAAKLNINSVGDVIDFGGETQSNIARSVDVVINDYRSDDAELSTGNQIIKETVNQAKSLDLSPLMSDHKWKKYLPFTKTRKQNLAVLEHDFKHVASSMDNASDVMVDMMDGLLYRIDALEVMYQDNLQYLRELNTLMAVGELRINYTTTVQLEDIKARYKKGKDDLVRQEMSDIERALEAFDRKMMDLRTTRISVIQTAPQIRIVQANNRSLVEKIHTTIMTVIPLWKKQFILAMSLLEQQDATSASKSIRIAMNTVLMENSDLLRKSGIDIQKEMSTEMIGVGTLQHIQESLVSVIENTLTPEEVNDIQNDLQPKNISYSVHSTRPAPPKPRSSNF